MMLLNLGSGTTNLLPTLMQFGSGTNPYVVYNVDREDPATKVPGNCQYVKASAGALPFNAAAFDVVVAISPYGFGVVCPEVFRVLKPGGFIIALGNYANKYVKTLAIGLGKEEAEKSVTELTEGNAGEAGKIAAYLKENYTSSTSRAQSTTKLQAVRIWQKK